MILYVNAAINVLGSFAYLLKRKFYKRKDVEATYEYPIARKTRFIENDNMESDN